MAAQQKAWDQIEKVVTGLQNALQRLAYARVPVVAAPFQYTLGGGSEIAMAADAIQAHAETYMGLVEVGVGLDSGGRRLSADGRALGVGVACRGGPAAAHRRGLAQHRDREGGDERGGGEEARALAEERRRHPEPGPPPVQRQATRARSGARRLSRAAAARCFTAAGYDAASTIGMRVWGMVESKFASEHDALVANKLAYVLCGGQVAAGTELTEQAFLDLEREAFLSLCGEQKSLDRMQHMLQHNKPLRN